MQLQLQHAQPHQPTDCGGPDRPSQGGCRLISSTRAAVWCKYCLEGRPKRPNMFPRRRRNCSAGAAACTRATEGQF